jgi:quercetin dioxygenase-like cupin family protein
MYGVPVYVADQIQYLCLGHQMATQSLPCRGVPQYAETAWTPEATMTTTYTHIFDLANEAEPPADGILSRTIFQSDRIKAVVFGFAQGQELSEHTAAKPAMLFFVKGAASVGLGEDIQEAQIGTWIHMPAGLKHSIKAKTPVVMLLVLLK